MYNIHLKIFFYGNEEIEIKADEGVALLEKKQIFLDKKVSIIMTDGDTVEALSVLIQYDKGIVSSDRPVLVQSKNDKISANGFKIFYSKKEKNITFYGNVKASVRIN